MTKLYPKILKHFNKKRDKNRKANELNDCLINYVLDEKMQDRTRVLDYFLIKNPLWGWQDGSVVKSADCSSKGPEFKSQQPHGGSQPSITKSDALFWSV